MDREATANIEIKKKANRIKHTTRKIKKKGGKERKKSKRKHTPVPLTRPSKELKHSVSLCLL